MSEKKVIAVIVEGPSDQNAIGGILKEYFSSAEVQFAVVHGDITSNNSTSVENAVSKVDQIIDEIRKRYGYNWEDFIKIIHIADTDGTFTEGCIIEGEVDSIQYYEDHMETSNVSATENRNKHKSEIMFKLWKTGKVHEIRYRLYFNSCNLEHVLYNELKDYSDEEKEELSDEFAEKYDGKVADFISFISDSEFEKMIEENGLVEHAGYCHHYYGTPKKFVEEQIGKGKDVILEIEIQGALQIKKKFPEALLLFVMPPNVPELERRLRGRGTETDEVIHERMLRAKTEAEGIEQYDYIIINDQLDECVEQTHAVIEAAHYTPFRNEQFIEEIRQQLDELI